MLDRLCYIRLHALVRHANNGSDMTEQQAGWYPDPSGDVSKLRYWNGVQWTNDFAPVQPSQSQACQGAAYTAPAYGQPPYQQPYSYEGSTDQTLRLVAFILCLVSTVSVGWTIIPLAWMIPMTVHCWGLYKGTKANTTGFGVCTLIFVNLVGGILLLVSRKDR